MTDSVRVVLNYGENKSFVVYLRRDNVAVLNSVVKSLNAFPDQSFSYFNHLGESVDLSTLAWLPNQTISLWVRQNVESKSNEPTERPRLESNVHLHDTISNGNDNQSSEESKQTQVKSSNNFDTFTSAWSLSDVESKKSMALSSTNNFAPSLEKPTTSDDKQSAIILPVIISTQNVSVGSESKTTTPTQLQPTIIVNDVSTTASSSIQTEKEAQEHKTELADKQPSSGHAGGAPITKSASATSLPIHVTVNPSHLTATNTPQSSPSQPSPSTSNTNAADARLQRILQKQQELERKMKEKEQGGSSTNNNSAPKQPLAGSKRAQSSPNLGNSVPNNVVASYGSSPHSAAAVVSSTVPSGKITAPDQSRYLEEKKRQEMEYSNELERRRQEALNEKSRQLTAMREDEKRRKEEDRKIKGFSERDTYRKNADEMQKEEKKQQEEEQRTGNKSWSKTEYGWQRAFEPQGQGYKSKPTRDNLPVWLYDELNISFGLRRSASPDFAISCSILQQLFTQWFLPSPKPMQKRMFADIAFAYNQLDKTNVLSVSTKTIEIVVDLFQTATKCVTDAKNDRKATFQSTQSEDAELEQIQKWTEGLKEIAARVSNAAEATVDQVSPFHHLPSEMIIEIFSWLNVPDLACVSLVCNRFNCLSNEEVLFNVFLKRHFPHKYAARLPSGQTYKELFVNAYLYLKRQRPNYWRTSGFFVCKQCNQFYWGAGNTKASCSTIRSSSHHEEESMVNPQKIVTAILGRKVAVASDVLFL